MRRETVELGKVTVMYLTLCALSVLSDSVNDKRRDILVV